LSCDTLVANQRYWGFNEIRFRSEWWLFFCYLYDGASLGGPDSLVIWTTLPFHLVRTTEGLLYCVIFIVYIGLYMLFTDMAGGHMRLSSRGFRRFVVPKQVPSYGVVFFCDFNRNKSRLVQNLGKRLLLLRCRCMFCGFLYLVVTGA
jgi:hypothetical protein